MQVRTLAAVLLAVAGALTGLAMAIPTPITIANAVLFWAWSFTALRVHRLAATGVTCHACGALDPMRLPDGSCARCAAPVKAKRQPVSA